MGFLKYLIVLLIFLTLIFYIFGEKKGVDIVKKGFDKMVEIAKKISGKVPKSETIENLTRDLKDDN